MGAQLMDGSTGNSQAGNVLEYARGNLGGIEPRLKGGDVLACGFGMTAAVWMAAYLCRLPFVQAPGEVTVGAMVAALLMGGFVAARYSAKGWWCAVWAGAVSGVLDILIVGALLHDYATTAHDAVVPSAAMWVLGSIALNAVVAGSGGLVGRLFPSRERGAILWTHVFAVILVCLTLLLIGAGGLVTAFHAGLAVPDWPRSYGYNMFLFPLSLMQQESGRFYEHSHRLLASLVGFTALTIAIHTTIAERRGWVKGLAWAIGFGVLIQAILGGTRVTETSVTLAIVHGVFAQLVFASMMVMAAVTSRGFYALPSVSTAAASFDRALTTGLVLSLVVQLMLGATLRHENQGVILHITMAVLVSVLVLACGFRAWGLYGSVWPLYRTGLAIMALVGVQLTLGVLALVFWTGNTKDAPLSSAIFTTLHQMNGALLLATSAALTIWTWRLLKPAGVEASEDLRVVPNV